jgi:SAM-dependent methyltransferase
MNIDNLKIPKESEKYIALQRTKYQIWFNTFFRFIKLGSFYDRFLMPKFERLRTNTIRKRFLKDIRNDFLSLKGVLPAKVENVLDIGCGIAGIDLFLYQNYKNHKPNLFLLDKEGISDVYYGFEEEASFYNSLSLSESFLTLNGVPKNKIHTINISKQDFPSENKFELIISLISWGFHYPVSTYLNEAYDSLSDNGILIIDIRKGTDGEEQVKDKFGN